MLCIDGEFRRRPCVPELRSVLDRAGSNCKLVPEDHESGASVDVVESTMETEEFVQQVIERLRLVQMIRPWNDVGGSKMADWNDFLLALDQSPNVLADDNAAEEEAEVSGVDGFEAEMKWQIEPVVRGSYLTGLLEEARAWAVEAIRGGPLKHEVTVRFADADQWANWMVANVAHPITLVDPDGRDLFDRHTADLLLRQGLMTERAAAMRSGLAAVRRRVVLARGLQGAGVPRRLKAPKTITP